MIRATKLDLLAKRCPAAVRYYDEGAPMDRSIFWPGTAAHDILHQVGLASGSADAIPAVVQHLITKGRGGVDASGPLPPDAVFAGRDIVLDWLAHEPWVMPDEAWFELGIGITRDGEIVPYSEDVWWGSRPDVVYLDRDLDEGREFTVLTERDYKTSWATSEADLETMQRKSQGLSVLRWWRASGRPDPTVLRLEVIALRSGQRFVRDVWLPAEKVIAQWTKDLEASIAATEAAEKSGEKRPGVNCVGCPYFAHCQPRWPHADIDTAMALVSAEASRAALVPELRALTRDAAALAVPGGAVGYRRTTKRVVRDDAAETLWRRLVGNRSERGTAGDMLAVRALQVSLTVTGVERLARLAVPGRAQKVARDALIAECVDVVPSVRFGVHVGD